MDATIEGLPKTGRVQINVSVSADMNFSAVAARKLVGRYVAEEISMFLRADDPALVVSERLHWRVPVSLHLPDRGLLGSVGMLDVDVETGQVLTSPSIISEFKRRAEDFVARPSS